MNAPIFNMGNAGRKQCAQRDDGVWFIRHRRMNGPGWTRWKLAPFTSRPEYAWYDGQHARLPNGNDTADERE